MTLIETLPHSTPKLPALPDGTRHIDAFLVDINGNMIGKRLPADQLSRIAEKGVQYSAAALILDSTRRRAESARPRRQ